MVRLEFETRLVSIEAVVEIEFDRILDHWLLLREGRVRMQWKCSGIEVSEWRPSEVAYISGADI